MLIFDTHRIEKKCMFNCPSCHASCAVGVLPRLEAAQGSLLWSHFHRFMESAADTDIFYFELPHSSVVELVFVAWELPSKNQILHFLGVESCPVLWPKEKLVATTGGTCATCNAARSDLVLCTYRCTTTAGYATEHNDFREICTDCVDPVQQSSFVDDHKKLIRLLETKYGQSILDECATVEAVTAFLEKHYNGNYRSSPNLIWQIPFIAKPTQCQIIPMQTFTLFANALDDFGTNEKKIYLTTCKNALRRAFVPYMVQFDAKPRNLLNPAFSGVQNNLWYDNALLIYLNRKGWLNFENLMQSELPFHKRLLSDSQFYTDQHAFIFGSKHAELFADENDTSIEFLPGAERVNFSRTITWTADQVREFDSEIKKPLRWWGGTQEGNEEEEDEKEEEAEDAVEEEEEVEEVEEEEEEEEEQGDDKASRDIPNKRLKTKTR